MDGSAGVALTSAPRARDDLDSVLEFPAPHDPDYAEALAAAIAGTPAHTPEQTDALGNRLLALLSDGSLELLRGPETNPAGAAAARVLSLGFPWALHLTPEQLALARAHLRPLVTRPSGLAFLASAAASGVALTLALLSVPYTFDGEPLGGIRYLAAVSVTMLVCSTLFAVGRLPTWVLGGLSSMMGVATWILADQLPLPGGGDLSLLMGVAPFGLGVLASVLPGRRRVQR